MAHRDHGARVFYYDLLVRLRSVGLWPWLALLGWGAFARTQEPLLFRSYGVMLTHQAIWFGATILLVPLHLAARPRLDLPRTVISSILLVSLVGLVQSAAAWVLDVAYPGAAYVTDLGASCARFVLVWLPASLGWISAPVASRPLLGRLGGLVVSLLLVGPAWRIELPLLLGASSLASLGVLLAAASGRASIPEPDRLSTRCQ